ncbi:MAG: replication protein RepA [Terriglobia bacterium]
MEHIGSIARHLRPAHNFDFTITQRTQKKRIESCELVRDLRDRQRQDLAFHSRPFVLCGLPIRCPAPGTLKYTRRNGRFVLEIVGHPDFGLPFGQDRLIPLWVATLAVRQKSKTILFRSAAEILEEFDLPRDGPHYRRLVDGFKRIFTSTIYFGTEAQTNREQLWDYRRFHFFDRLKVWYAREGIADAKPASNAGNIIGLSESFWQEIQAHPIPVDRNVVRGLTNNAGCLDLYMWLAWRCFNAKRTEKVPLFGAAGLATQLGVFEYTRDRNFRKRLREWLKTVSLYWPECPAQLTEDGLALFVAPARAIGSAATGFSRGGLHVAG